jgi:hypothetical protein
MLLSVHFSLLHMAVQKISWSSSLKCRSWEMTPGFERRHWYGYRFVRKGHQRKVWWSTDTLRSLHWLAGNSQQQVKKQQALETGRNRPQQLPEDSNSNTRLHSLTIERDHSVADVSTLGEEINEFQFHPQNLRPWCGDRNRSYNQVRSLGQGPSREFHQEEM